MAMLRSNCGSAPASHAFIARASFSASRVPRSVHTKTSWRHEAYTKGCFSHATGNEKLSPELNSET